MNRRGFFKQFLPFGLGIFGLGCIVEALAVIYGFLMPSQKRRYFKTFTCYSTDILPGEARGIRLRGNKLMLINNEGTIKAFSSVCPHLGCSVIWDQKGREFRCPCHLAVFDINGRVLKGPPPRPLDQYEVLLEGNSIFVLVPENYWAKWEA